MRGRHFVPLGLLALGLFVVAGCGGGGGGSTNTNPPPTSNNPTVTIDWPSRSRGIQAPPSALSVKITMQGANPDGSDVTVVATRDQETPYSKAYAMPIVTSGPRNLTVRFYADTFAAAEIANVTLSVVITPEGVIKRSDGRDLGNVTTATRIARVVVDGTNIVPVGVDSNLTAYAETADGRVSVSPGGIFWELVDAPGPDKLSVTAGGVARGARIGWQEVRATIDGIKSDPGLVKVGFQRSAIVNERADVFAACDGVGDLLWAVGTDGGLYQITKSSLFRNPSLVTVGQASDIARSADNHYVYVPTVEGVKRWNTLTATIDKTFVIDGPNLEKVPHAIAVDPTTPLRTAVSFTTNDDKFVTALYEDGTRKFSALTTDTPVRGLTFSETGRYVFAYTEGGSLIRLEVGPNGLTESGSRINGITFRPAAPYIDVAANKLYTHNLDTFDVTSFTAVAAPERLGVGYGVLAERGITPRVYSAQVENAGRANAIIVYQDSGSGPVPITGLDIPVDRLVADLVAADANGFVFMSSGATLVRVSVSN
ncbi:MAG: hypothetical protein ACO1SV_25905 [Fimbriimonas sp.]